MAFIVAAWAASLITWSCLTVTEKSVPSPIKPLNAPPGTVVPKSLPFGWEFSLRQGGLIICHGLVPAPTLERGINWRFRQSLWESWAKNSIWAYKPYWSLGKAAPYGWTVVIPLWIPFLLVGVPTALLFWRDRRMPSHCCQACGYDLTGNTSGLCPECGKATGHETSAEESFVFAVRDPAGAWLTCPEARKRRSLVIICETMAELCKMPATSINPSQSMRSLWRMQFDGGDELELMDKLEERIGVKIDIEWWQAQFGGDNSDRMSFKEFAERVADYVQTKPPTCRCGYNLTGNTSGVCPECGGQVA